MYLNFRIFMIVCWLFAGSAAVAGNTPDDDLWWWDDAWWDEGFIPIPYNYAIETSWTSYRSGDVEVPALVARPAGDGRFPAVLFVHGRRGLGDLVQRHVRRIAARGFVVLAPDIYQAHFIGTHPIEHDYELEKDVDRAVDVLLARADISTDRACLYSHTRGGYYALKVATTFNRQHRTLPAMSPTTRTCRTRMRLNRCRFTAMPRRSSNSNCRH